jgi:hypothetical protein
MRTSSWWPIVRGTVVLTVGGAVIPAGAAEPFFADHAALAGIRVNQTPAVNFTLSPVNVSSMLGAGAVGDFNRDGWQDIYVVNGGDGPDSLFINNQDGSFSDVAEAAGLATGGRTSSS